MSNYYCGGCERVRNVRCDGYEDVGDNLGVCDDCAADMEQEAVADIMEHWELTAPASEVSELSREGLRTHLYHMTLADLLARHRNLKGEK